MIIDARVRRSPGLLAAGLLGVVALAGCGSEVDGQGSASTPSSSAASSSASSSGAGSTGGLDDVADLSAGLLPASAFGTGAQATPITAEQVQGQAQLGGLGTEGLTITPESCAPALKTVQPGLEDMDAFGAQTVVVGSGATVEVLASGAGLTAGIDQLTSTLDQCSELTLSSPDIGTATVTFAELAVPDLGDGSAGLTMTIETSGPGGQPVTVPVLLAMAADGDRLVSLTATDPTGAVDPGTFGDLLQQAFDHQADELD
ncbi:hypothetical protein [Modestobacter versicolor]|uniref:hypothetical protein n=1 Tax=Modestobacter versicolor TaxID=429133 RepID=UPI0034DFD653